MGDGEVGIAVGEEYRRDERYPVNGDAEVVVLGGTSLFRGRIMDISVSGCYIQTLAWVRLRPDTPVEILFAVDGKVVRALAASRFVKSKVGIGFRFVKMNDDMQRKLDELIDGARTRYMELTHEATGMRQPRSTPAAAMPKPVERAVERVVERPVDPAALQVVARREQERAGSGTISASSSPQAGHVEVASGPGVVPVPDPIGIEAAAPAAATSEAPEAGAVSDRSPLDEVVEEAAVAVASLEQDAAGVQASQMLEVSELSKVSEPSKVEEPSQPSPDPARPESPLAGDLEEESASDASAEALMLAAAHTFEVDEDASDVGHVEIWRASSDVIL